MSSSPTGRRADGSPSSETVTPSGRNGRDYIRGRVDKACLEYAEDEGGGGEAVNIGLVAELIEPYAVFLR